MLGNWDMYAIACAVAKLNGHDPWAYMKDVLERLPTLPNRELATLLPHNWRAPATAATR